MGLGGWGLFSQRPAGEILLRLTYKAYVDDEEDEKTVARSFDGDVSDDDLSDSEQLDSNFSERIRVKSYSEPDKESFMDVLADLIVSEEFLGIVSSETGNGKYVDDVKSAVPTSTLRSPPSRPPQQTEQIPESSTESFRGNHALKCQFTWQFKFGLSFCIN